jgi:glutamate 5-kinase
MGLVQLYEVCFRRRGMPTGQVLFTHDDLESRQRYLNARSTLRTLLSLGVVPVVNENDTVSTDEVKLGDNDTLAALAANLVDADREQSRQQNGHGQQLARHRAFDEHP